MPLFGKREQAQGTGYAQEIDAAFEDAMVRTSNALRRLTDSQLPEDQMQQLFDDAFQLGVDWTTLADNGYFVSVAKPYAESFASIVLGMKENRPDEVKKGVGQIIEIARGVSNRAR
jgi:hypothetical protein